MGLIQLQQWDLSVMAVHSRIRGLQEGTQGQLQAGSDPRRLHLALWKIQVKKNPRGADFVA